LKKLLAGPQDQIPALGLQSPEPPASKKTTGR